MAATAPTRPYTRPPAPTLLHADALYSLAEFFKASGLGRTSLRRARERGIELETLRVGRLKYVKGRDAIAFVEAAAVAFEDAA